MPHVVFGAMDVGRRPAAFAIQGMMRGSAIKAKQRRGRQHRRNIPEAWRCTLRGRLICFRPWNLSLQWPMTGRGESPHHARVECGTAEQPAARDGAYDDVWHGISLVQGFQSETERCDAFEFCLRRRPVWISYMQKSRRGGTHSLPRTSLV